MARGVGDLVHGALEGFLVALRRHAVAADFAHELERGGADLVVCGELVVISKANDAATHAHHDKGSARRRSPATRRTPGDRPSLPASSSRKAMIAARSTVVSGADSHGSAAAPLRMPTWPRAAVSASASASSRAKNISTLGRPASAAR